MDGDDVKGIIYQLAYFGAPEAELANGQAASIDIIGSVSNNQFSLTAGQVFVQTDGTISTTTDDPSVLQGLLFQQQSGW